MKTTLAGYAIAGSLGGGIQTIFAVLFGHGEIRFLIFLLYLMLLVFDFIAGTSASEKDGSYGSIYGRNGFGRLIVYMFIPAAGNLIDRALNITDPFIIYGYTLDGFAFGFLTFTFGYHIAKSAVANAHRARWNPPEILVRWTKNEIDLKEARAIARIQEKEQLLNMKER